MKKKIIFISSMLMFIQLCAMSNTPQSERIENFAGFPGEPSEPLYYVREYPYTTMFIVAAAVSGMLYYHRNYFRKRMRQILRMLTIQDVADDTSQ